MMAIVRKSIISGYENHDSLCRIDIVPHISGSLFFSVYLYLSILLFLISNRTYFAFAESCEQQVDCSDCLSSSYCEWCSPQGFCLTKNKTYSGENATSFCKSLGGNVSSVCPSGEDCGTIYAPEDCNGCIANSSCGYCNASQLGSRCFQSQFGNAQIGNTACKIFYGVWNRCPDIDPGSGSTTENNGTIFIIPPGSGSSPSPMGSTASLGWGIVGAALGLGLVICLCIFVMARISKSGKRRNKRNSSA